MASKIFLIAGCLAGAWTFFTAIIGSIPKSPIYDSRTAFNETRGWAMTTISLFVAAAAIHYVGW